MDSESIKNYMEDEQLGELESSIIDIIQMAEKSFKNKSCFEEFKESMEHVALCNKLDWDFIEKHMKNPLKI